MRVQLRVLLASIALVVLGAALIAIGGFLTGLSEYERSIFAHIGTAILLVAPLLVAERSLRGRVRVASDRAAEAAQSAQFAQAAVDDIDRKVRDQATQFRTEEEERLKRAENGDFQALAELYAEARTRGWLDRLGLRVSTEVDDLWLRLRAVRPAPGGRETSSIELSLEGADLERIGAPVIWSEGEAADGPLGRLEGELRRTDRWPGDGRIEWSRLLQRVAETIGLVIGLHVGPGGNYPVRQVVEIPNSEWAVTREGLESLVDPDLAADHRELVFRKRGLLEELEADAAKMNLEMDPLRSAFDAAVRIHRVLRKDDYADIIDFGRSLDR